MVLTGASRGIGESLAKKLISAGAHLFLIARSEDRLKELCEMGRQNGCQMWYRAIDLRDSKALDSLCEELKTTLPQVDFFFCNAGKSIHRTISKAEDRLHDYDRTMSLNYRSLVALSLALLPALRASKGRIIYTSSVSTLYPPAPGWSAYHASKCASNIWCETAQTELASQGIKVKIAYLPLVHTDMSDVNATYRKMPALSADDAADILLRLGKSSRSSYKPWWAIISVPIASLLTPIIRLVYRHIQ